VKWLVLIALFVTAACTAPCDQLADNICHCEPDPTTRASCEQQISAEDANVHPTNADQNLCSQKLKTCNCLALSRGDRDACGLTRETDNR
jgi:hypothetical protein